MGSQGLSPGCRPAGHLWLLQGPGWGRGGFLHAGKSEMSLVVATASLSWGAVTPNCGSSHPVAEASDWPDTSASIPPHPSALRALESLGRVFHENNAGLKVLVLSLIPAGPTPTLRCFAMTTQSLLTPPETVTGHPRASVA